MGGETSFVSRLWFEADPSLWARTGDAFCMILNHIICNMLQYITYILHPIAVNLSPAGKTFGTGR